jgi:hypothetical protein
MQSLKTVTENSEHVRYVHTIVLISSVAQETVFTGVGARDSSQLRRERYDLPDAHSRTSRS